MTDTYWERLLAGYTEMGSAGPEHPDLQAGDPALLARLMAPSPEEAHYTAPDVATRDVTVTHGTGAFPVRVYTPHGDPKGEPATVRLGPRRGLGRGRSGRRGSRRHRSRGVRPG